MAERREFARRSVERVVLVTSERGDSTHAFTYDVSAGGLSLSWPGGTSLRSGTTVTVELPLGRSRSRIKTRCEVRAISSGHATSAPARRIHLAFVDDDPLFRRIIAGALDSAAG
jgi:c-di-GMP-binding flagellar brake protein YcgR